ncbi:hypothetical protein [Endozoicomonas sp. SCSIO W0465]|uniref:hypothetical protein n=1 Tax=Endozoicomonas sp. SCSIO W0465 TaxID=2918516 RepID=UPI002075A454|nr:hypothetical protein [Endozoicomonas sp. SCSIO W0465]USE33841.1 hypothetical protein MJO57_16850 [Endozoicomonas sp. SCSIO W0465]
MYIIGFTIDCHKSSVYLFALAILFYFYPALRSLPIADEGGFDYILRKTIALLTIDGLIKRSDKAIKTVILSAMGDVSSSGF